MPIAALHDPMINAATVTKSDTVELPNVTRGLLVGSIGDVKVTFLGGHTVTLFNLAAGVIHPVRVTQVWSTGTEPTEIVALR
jgi:hypothetical protein